MRALAGAFLTLAGAAALIFFTFVSYGRGPFLDRWSIALGLAGLPFLSAVAQIVALIGAALVWRATRRQAR
jgi:hypothetical protein